MKPLLICALMCLGAFANAQYNTLCWKIFGNGARDTSYLYGTMHTSDKRVFNFSEQVTAAFDGSKAYAMELDPSNAFQPGLLSRVMMGKGQSLKKMIPESNYKTLDSTFKASYGFGLAMFDNVAPVFVMTMYESVQLGVEESALSNKEVLDLYWYKQAKKQKKKIIGIETVEEQISALNALSYQEQAELLVNEMNQAGTDSGSDGHDLMDYYLRGALDSLALFDSELLMQTKYAQSLLTDRNQRMADRIGKTVKQQKSFVAIGAMHLPTPTGVIALLRAQGFTVEPIN